MRVASLAGSLAATLATAPVVTPVVPPTASHAADRKSAKPTLASTLASTPVPPSLDIHFEVAGTQEVLHWLLGYGAAVQVLAPLSLVEAHKRELSGGLARYPADSPLQSTQYQSAGQTLSPPTPAASEKNKTLRKPRTSVVRPHR